MPYEVLFNEIQGGFYDDDDDDCPSRHPQSFHKKAGCYFLKKAVKWISCVEEGEKKSNWGGAL